MADKSGAEAEEESRQVDGLETAAEDDEEDEQPAPTEVLPAPTRLLPDNQPDEEAEMEDAMVVNMDFDVDLDGPEVLSPEGDARRDAELEGMLGHLPAANQDHAVSVVIGPMVVRDVSKAAEFIAALRAVRDAALSEGRATEYDVYVTTDDGVVCNENSAATTNEAGPYFLREIYPTKAAQDAHDQGSEALAAFRAVKGALADFKNPERAVDIPRAQVTEGKVVSEGELLASVNHEEELLINLNVEPHSDDEEVNIDAQLEGLLGHLPPSEHVAPTGSQDLVEQARQQSEELQQQIEEFRGHKTSLQLQVEQVKAQAALLKQQIDQSYPRTKRQFESKAKDIEALSGQEKELCNSISEKIEQAQHRFSQFAPERDKAIESIQFEQEMKRSADLVTAQLKQQAEATKKENSSIRLQISKVQQQKEQQKQLQDRWVDGKRLTKKQLVCSTNAFHELRTQLKEEERAKREVAGMAKIHIEQQMEKELQKAEWQPRMLLQRRKKKQDELDEQLIGEEMQRRALKKCQVKGELVREYNKALVKAVKTMQVNIEDTEELNLSHPEALNHLSRIQGRVKQALDQTLAEIESRALELKLPPIGVKNAEFDRLDVNLDGVIDQEEFLAAREELRERTPPSNDDEAFEVPEKVLMEIADQIDHKIKAALSAEDNRYTEELGLLQQKRQSCLPAKQSPRKQQSPRTPPVRRAKPGVSIKARRVASLSEADKPSSWPFQDAEPIPNRKAPLPQPVVSQQIVNLALADLLAQGEAELAVMNEEKLIEGMMHNDDEQQPQQSHEGAAAGSLSSIAAEKVRAAQAELKHAQNDELKLQATHVLQSAEHQLQIANLAEQLLGVDEANCLQQPERRAELVQQLLDLASCITKRNQQQAEAAIQLLGALPGGLSSSSEARRIVHVIAQRVAEEGKPLHAHAMDALTRLASSKTALPVLLSCFASSRSSRPVAAGSSPAAALVSRAAAAAVQQQLEQLGDGLEAWTGQMIETVVRAMLDGLSHSDNKTKAICSAIARLLHKRMPNKLAKLAQRCAPSGGMAKVQAAVHAR